MAKELLSVRRSYLVLLVWAKIDAYNQEKSPKTCASCIEVTTNEERTLVLQQTHRKWLEWTSYVFVLMVLFSPSIIDANKVVGVDVDMRGTLWYYWWIKDSLLNGKDSTFTTLLCYPYGIDILAQTGNNFVDAYLSIPFQYLFGFPGYFSIFVMTLFIGNGLAFRSLMTTLQVSPTARWIATLFWLINPFVIHELMWGRPTQALLFFSLLAIRSFFLLHREAKIWHAVLLGIWTGLQGLTYWYAGYFLAFVLLWLSLFLFQRGALISSVQKMLRHYATSIASCFLLIGFAVYRIFDKAVQNQIPGHGLETSNWLQPAAVNNFSGGQIWGYQLTEA